jgi:hypothetical protein
MTGENWGVLRHPPMGALCVVPVFAFFWVFWGCKHIKSMYNDGMNKTRINPDKMLYQVQVDRKLLKKAKEKAHAEDLKLTQVIRRFLMDYVNNPQGKLFN